MHFGSKKSKLVPQGPSGDEGEVPQHYFPLYLKDKRDKRNLKRNVYVLIGAYSSYWFLGSEFAR